MSEPINPELQIDFPCVFEFKAFGDAGERFIEDVYLAVAAVATVSRDALRSRHSSAGSYQCVTVAVMLHGSQQLTAVYAALRTVEGIRYLV